MWSEDPGPPLGLSVFDQTQKERVTRLSRGLRDDNARSPPAEQATRTRLCSRTKGATARFRVTGLMVIVNNINSCPFHIQVTFYIAHLIKSKCK